LPMEMAPESNKWEPNFRKMGRKGNLMDEKILGRSFRQARIFNTDDLKSEKSEIGIDFIYSSCIIIFMVNLFMVCCSIAPYSTF
jgi:hypothetical protein